jgi:hypothetical protein
MSPPNANGVDHVIRPSSPALSSSTTTTASSPLTSTPIAATTCNGTSHTTSSRPESGLNHYHTSPSKPMCSTSPWKWGLWREHEDYHHNRNQEGSYFNDWRSYLLWVAVVGMYLWMFWVLFEKQAALRQSSEVQGSDMVGQCNDTTTTNLHMPMPMEDIKQPRKSRLPKLGLGKARQWFQKSKTPSNNSTTTKNSTATATTNTATSTTNPQSIQIYAPYGFTEPVELSSELRSLLLDFRRRVYDRIPDIRHRSESIQWGGSHHHGGFPWWYPTSNHSHAGRDHPWDHVDGLTLLYNYYIVIKRHMPKHNQTIDLSHVHFPVRMCKGAHGCAAEQAVDYTLQWRTDYQPWCVPPSLLQENAQGWAYTRGFAHPTPSAPHHGAHAMVWIRVGQHRTMQVDAYFRAIVHALERAVTAALHHSHGRVGRINVVVDGAGFEWDKLPDIRHIQQTVHILQDVSDISKCIVNIVIIMTILHSTHSLTALVQHYSNRLGLIVIVNTSRMAELFINVMKKLITKEVGEKIRILSHNPEKRLEELKALVEERYIPTWLGMYGTV